MLLKEKVIEEIDNLDTQQLMEIYGLILALKKIKTINETIDNEIDYLLVQKILSKIEGNLSDYIIEEREDRL